MMEMGKTYQAASENKSLMPLIEEYRKLLDGMDASYRKIIGKFKKDLIPLLCGLYDEYNPSALPRLEVLDQHRVCTVDLRDIKPGLAIRFCGRFFNMLEIDSKDEGIITLGYGITEDDDIPEERFDTDCYVGQQAIRHAMYLEHADIRNVVSFARQLSVYFEGSEHFHEYCKIKNELFEAADKVDREPLDDLEYTINAFLVNLVKQHCSYDETQEMHYLKLPDGISIRYYGRYCNCLITKGLRIWLGYLRSNSNFLNEEMYGNDGYTSKRMAEDRYYQLLHSTPLGGQTDKEHTFKALVALKSTCASPIDIDVFDYVPEEDILKQ